MHSQHSLHDDAARNPSIGISRCDGDQRTPKYFDEKLGYNNGAASLPTRIVVVVLTRVESWSLSAIIRSFRRKRQVTEMFVGVI